MKFEEMKKVLEVRGGTSDVVSDSPEKLDSSVPGTTSTTIGLADQEFDLQYVTDYLPTPNELHVASVPAAMGMVSPLVLDEHRRVLAGEVSLLTAVRLGMTDVPCLVYPFRSEEQKRDLVKVLHPSHVEKQPLTDQSTATSPLKLTRADCQAWARLHKKRSTAGKGDCLCIVVPALKELPKVLEALSLFSVGDLPSKKVTAKRLLRLEREAKKRLLALVPPSDVQQGTVRFLHGDFQTRSLDIPDSSCHLVLTDPPYGKAFLPELRALGQMAHRILKPGGLLIMYYGNQYLRQALIEIGESLTHLFTFALYHKDKRNVVWGTKMISVWKPILVFAKPPVKKYWKPVPDLIVGSGKEQDWHPWEQNLEESKYLLKTFCPVGGTVVDLCMGSGTVMIAAQQLSHLGIQAIGIEKDAVRFQDAQERILGIESEKERLLDGRTWDKMPQVGDQDDQEVHHG